RRRHGVSQLDAPLKERVPAGLDRNALGGLPGLAAVFRVERLAGPAAAGALGLVLGVEADVENLFLEGRRLLGTERYGDFGEGLALVGAAEQARARRGQEHARVRGERQAVHPAEGVGLGGLELLPG